MTRDSNTSISFAKERQISVQFAGRLSGIIFIMALTTIGPDIVLAHQPVLETDSIKTAAEPHIIEDPEISKAIYSVLQGRPHYYRIDSEKPFRFYAGITQAKREGCPLSRTFSFEILDDKLQVLEVRDGESFTWWEWYEPFGRNWYWIGPEVGAEFKSDREYSAGTYYVRVYNRENEGRYVLAVGDEEKFPLPIIARTIFVLPKINRQFWEDGAC